MVNIKYDTRTIPELIRDFHANHGLKIINPKITEYTLAINYLGSPLVTAKILKVNGVEKWLIVISDLSYMFKDNGFFGYTENPEDKAKNTFDYIDEAIEAFNKFHNTPSVSESIPINKGGMDKYFLDLEAYEESFCCNECGNDRKSEFMYQRSVSNGEIWVCKICKSEILPSHKPNEDHY